MAKLRDQDGNKEKINFHVVICTVAESSHNSCYLHGFFTKSCYTGLFTCTQTEYLTNNSIPNRSLRYKNHRLLVFCILNNSSFMLT